MIFEGYVGIVLVVSPMVCCFSGPLKVVLDGYNLG